MWMQEGDVRTLGKGENVNFLSKQRNRGWGWYMGERGTAMGEGQGTNIFTVTATV